MREIKFRGYSDGYSAWKYGFGVSVVELSESMQKELGVKEIVYLHTDEGKVSVVAESVGQYTGLKDVNGREIYEGDVLEERYLDEIDTLKVFYFGSGFMVEQVYEPNADFNLDGCDINKLYVVGNIYKK